MMRFHVHVTTRDLHASIATYSLVFGPPVVEKPDYAKWEPEAMPLVFAVSTRKPVSGIDHVGIRADSEAELATMIAGLRARGLPHAEQRDAECCYVRADKTWVTDPNGIAWELYAGTGSIETFGEDRRPETAGECCESAADAPPTLLGLQARLPTRAPTR
jgi:hypothetical protein